MLLVIGLVQSIFTNIGLDESYYWRFAQDLDWGYFDHPPMVALMIAIGNSFLPGTIGVRLMTILLSLGTYYLIWKMIPEESRNKKSSAFIFLLLILANPLINIYSFITTPDVPLIFFSALYLLLFKKFLKEANFKNSALLGLVMACLIYSKYHGLLLILITVLAQPRLFLRPHIYIAGLSGVILYLPHLYWQYEHDFISFEYHLSYRSVQFYMKNVYMYFINVILVLNPFLLPLFLITYFRNSGNAAHNRTLNAVLWVFLGFFAFTSFRGHVEPQWIVVVVIPMTIYLHTYITSNDKTKRIFYPLATISVVLVLIARSLIMIPFDVNSEFHKPNRTYYETIKNMSDDKPVIFVNSYTHASRYSFYTGDSSFSYNNVSFRKNQYDLWKYHNVWHKKNVLFTTFHDVVGYEDTIIQDSKPLYYKFVDNIPFVNNVKVEILDYDKKIKEKSEFWVKFKVTNPYDDDLDFEELQLTWRVYFFYLDKERADFARIVKGGTDYLKANSTTEVEAYFYSTLPPKKYTIGMHLYPKQLFPITTGKRTNPIEVVD